MRKGMRASWVLLCLFLPCGAGAPLRVAAVERRGWPPFEDDRRTYRIAGEGAASLQPGEVLLLHRPGDPRDPGRLKVTARDGAQALAHLAARGATYPLVGDRARPWRAAPVPGFPANQDLADLGLRPPKLEPPMVPAVESRAAAAHAALREAIHFLEGDAALSPKGREKLQRLVREWGASGPWILSRPESRLLPETVRQARVQAIRKALAGFGAGRVEVREIPRPDGSTGDVVYVGKE